MDDSKNSMPAKNTKGWSPSGWDWIIIPPFITIPKYLWENALRPFFEKETVSTEDFTNIEALIDKAVKNGATEIKLKLEKRAVMGLQNNLSKKYPVVLGAEKEGKIEVTIKFKSK